MSASKKQSGVGRLIGGVVVLLVVAGLAGLLFVDWRAAVAVVVGIGAGWLVRGLLRRVWQSKRRGLWIGLVVGIVILGGIVAGGLALFGAGGMEPLAGSGGGAAEPAGEEAAEAPEPPLVGRIDIYRVNVQPGESLAAGVEVSEAAVYTLTKGGGEVVSGQIYEVPVRSVASERRGFLLREVTIIPWQTGATSNITLTAPDGETAVTRVCTFVSCAPSEVEITGLPKGSFFAARGVEDVTVTPYVNEEIVNWRSDDVSDGIVFAYIPSPFQVARPVLAPFIGASTASDWTVGLITLVGTVVAMPLVQPVLENIFQDWLADQVRALFGRKKDSRSPRK